ncbi:hypothetical protein ASPVEDRAFT_35885 [Aspergillus versicolor CBS 583.65]|uniref:Uncharacterized protein n=1 Tax=Aspergillus versicolor CBS 583.65 TaxID=1036611 RepID=A0A1L9P4T5_ASPVE|nr:uncharacterized protein ASPVEDRAFT_35885 [Aspergillus versicolor CBS 583.65]OJI96512.1 hypothetical protein ASPVEDRAFT_35885 [Aspergillus versicolor CBS 583.65]
MALTLVMNQTSSVMQVLGGLILVSQGAPRWSSATCDRLSLSKLKRANVPHLSLPILPFSVVMLSEGWELENIGVTRNAGARVNGAFCL